MLMDDLFQDFDFQTEEFESDDLDEKIVSNDVESVNRGNVQKDDSYENDLNELRQLEFMEDEDPEFEAAFRDLERVGIGSLSNIFTTNKTLQKIGQYINTILELSQHKINSISDFIMNMKNKSVVHKLNPDCLLSTILYIMENGKKISKETITQHLQKYSDLDVNAVDLFRYYRYLQHK
jgi:hypothetical protein